jgi:hypothetical protein
MTSKDLIKLLSSFPDFEVKLCATTKCDTGWGIAFERFKINGLEDVGYSDNVVILDIERCDV